MTAIRCPACGAWRAPEDYYWHRRTVKGRIYVNRDVACKRCERVNRQRRYWRNVFAARNAQPNAGGRQNTR